MKCRELGDVLKKIASLVHACGGRTAGSDALDQVLSIGGDRTVAQLAKAIARVEPKPVGARQDSVAEAIDYANAMRLALSGIVKAAVATDLLALSTAMSPHKGSEFQEFVASVEKVLVGGKTSVPQPPAREDVVRRYQVALEDALGDDDGFAAVLKSLGDDPQVRIPEIVAIAKRFAFASTKTRAAALKKIQARHQSLMTSRAKAAATAGRIAG